MLKLQVIEPYRYLEIAAEKKAANHVMYLTNNQNIRREFSKRFMADRYDDGTFYNAEFDQMQPVYRDYLSRFHGTEIDREPIEVESPWVIKSGEMHALTETLYDDILFPMLIIAAKDRPIAPYIGNMGFNNIALRFLIESEETYSAYVSCFNSFWEFLDYIRSNEAAENPERFWINDTPVNEELIWQLDSSYAWNEKWLLEFLDHGNKKWKEHNLDRGQYVFFRDHYSVLSMKEFLYSMFWDEMTGEHDDMPVDAHEYEIHMHMESTKRGGYSKYAGTLRVICREDGSRDFEGGKNLNVYYGGIEEYLLESLREMPEDCKTFALACFEYELSIETSSEDLYDDLLKKVKYYILIDKDRKVIDIWGGDSFYGRIRFSEELDAFMKEDGHL